MENIAQTIAALTSMIEVNNQRMKLYRSLGEKMHHQELRTLFFHLGEQSRQFASALSTWRGAYGGYEMPMKNGKGGVLSKMTSLFYHLVRKNVATQCKEMEEDALKIYRSAIQGSFLPAAATGEIERQSGEFEKALFRLKAIQAQPNKVREELVHAVAV